VTPPPEIALNGQDPCQLHPGAPAAVGRHLCWEDIRTVTAALDPDNDGDRDTQTPASIPAYWARLDAAPGRGGDDGRRAPGFRSTPPCNLHVVAMRDPRSRPDPRGRDDVSGEPRPVETALANLARGLWDHLDLQGPDLPNGDVTPGGVPALAGWLHAHVEQLTAHPDAGAIALFLGQLVEQLRTAAGDPRDRPVGRCIEWIRDPHSLEQSECGAPLFLPPPRPGVEVASDEPVLQCRRCRRRYAGRDLIRLRLANEQEAA
jgi:hypothetical protein